MSKYNPQIVDFYELITNILVNILVHIKILENIRPRDKVSLVVGRVSVVGGFADCLV